MSNMLVNILQTKCPRCHKGDLFESKNPYHFGKMTVSKTHCSSCGLKYEIEPGFFFGAMYISYALNVALFVFFMLFVLDDKISTRLLFFIQSYLGFLEPSGHTFLSNLSLIK